MPPDETSRVTERVERLCEAAIGRARAQGARYVEARLVHRTRDQLHFKDRGVDKSHVLDDFGLGVRALVGDRWGYASTNLLDLEVAGSCGAAAARAATLGSASGHGRSVDVPEPVEGRYETPMEIDPLALSPAERAAPFLEALDTLMSVEGVTGARGLTQAMRNTTWLRASNGTRIDQAITLAGGGLTAVASKNGERQVRSVPKTWEGNLLQGGFEVVLAEDLPGQARRVAEEAVALTTAEQAPKGDTTVILAGSQLSLQIHESVGHPTELDRAFGEEISLAGASFLLPERLDELQFGSELVNLTADSTTPLGPGTFGFDDEGTPARATPLVERGRFVGYLSGRDEARRLDRTSAACLRAESWRHLPIVRMVNVNLEPGEGTLEDLIAGVDEGLLLDANKSWSIDELRLNFQFGCEIAYEIKGGRLTGKIYRNPVYFGITPKFWGRCSAIAGPEAWKMWGWGSCGKGDPIQLMHVGHGCAPARFDAVRVSHT